MFGTEWIFTIFSSVIPIEDIGYLLDEFFSESWIYLYKFIIHLLRTHEKTILEKEDISEMLSPIRNFKVKGVFEGFLSAIPFLNSILGSIRWKELIEGANGEVINEKYLKQLLNLYDLENMRFKYDIVKK